MPVQGGFGISLLQTIDYCARGNIKITIIDSGKQKSVETDDQTEGLGMTSNFHQHADFLTNGQLSGEALNITVKFDSCGGNDIYTVVASPQIPIVEKRKKPGHH